MVFVFKTFENEFVILKRMRCVSNKMATNELITTDYVQQCLTLTSSVRHVSEKQWDKRIVERVLELINAGAHEDVVDAYLLTAGLKHAHAKRDVLGRFKQEKKKEATTDRLRAKLASRKSGVGYVG